MRRFYVILLIAMACLQVQAQSMRKIWLSMPDSIIPYLNKNQRLELVDYVDLKVKPEVKNQLRETSVIDTLTTNYMSITLNKASKMQLRLLPTTNEDSILCMVRTFNGPLPESSITFYTPHWQRLESPSIDLQQFAPSLIVRPDTMSQARFDELKGKIEVITVEASLTAENDNLMLRTAVPLLSHQEKESIRLIFLQRKLNWNGTTYN